MDSRYSIILSVVMSMLFMASCQDKDTEATLTGEERLQFRGVIADESEIDTRATETQFIRRGDYDLIFYIESVVNNNVTCSTYMIPDNQSGVLRGYATTDTLHWASKRDVHNFYSWTMPWEDRDPFVEEKKDATRISFDVTDEMYSHLPEGERSGILEKFIGSKFGPTTFEANGEFINFEFMHLVSKVKISRMRLQYQKTSGDIEYTLLSGKMTFYNLPREGVFIRAGENGPVVLANPDEDKQEISFQLDQNVEIYVCPGVDWSQVEFRLSDHNGPKENYGDFFGDFKKLNIVRDENDEWDKDKDPHILYANEVMVLTIDLYQSSKGNFRAQIGDWSNQGLREGTVYGKAGFYDESNMRYIYDALNQDYSEENQDRMFELYGDHESGEYRLYDDLDNVSHGFRMGKYVLNGMGHTISFATYDNSVIRISRARDIYLTDGNGNTVYIDEDFNVYKVNEDGTMTKTGQLDELTGENRAYTINLSTGVVNQTKDI